MIEVPPVEKAGIEAAAESAGHCGARCLLPVLSIYQCYPRNGVMKNSYLSAAAAEQCYARFFLMICTCVITFFDLSNFPLDLISKLLHRIFRKLLLFSVYTYFELKTSSTDFSRNTKHVYYRPDLEKS